MLKTLMQYSIVFFKDDDADGNGIPDKEEDKDGDGLPDYLDADVDGDGILDRFQTLKV